MKKGIPIRILKQPSFEPDIGKKVKKKLIAEVTQQALSEILGTRYYRYERGFQGAFYTALHRRLVEKKLINQTVMLEMEVQKNAEIHGITQRPDIVLHVPMEYSGLEVTRNNFVVWALKRNATQRRAIEDFEKLNSMISVLDYRWAVFVNIDSDNTWSDYYVGPFRRQFLFFATRFEKNIPEIVKS